MPNDKEKTGHGIITELSEILTHSGGKKFRVINLGDRKFSCWESELLNEFQVGASIQFQYTTATKGGKTYHNIVSLESDGDRPQTGGAGQPTKDELIVRQTAIKVAGPMMGVNADTPAEKVKEVTEIAEGLVKWVWEKKSSEPEPPPEEGE